MSASAFGVLLARRLNSNCDEAGRSGPSSRSPCLASLSVCIALPLCRTRAFSLYTPPCRSLEVLPPAGPALKSNINFHLAKSHTKATAKRFPWMRMQAHAPPPTPTHLPQGARSLSTRLVQNRRFSWRCRFSVYTSAQWCPSGDFS